MTRPLLAALEEWKSRFGAPETGQLERLLAAAAKHKFRGAQELVRFHETLLFLRAYPRTQQVARLADALLASFPQRIAAMEDDLDPFEAPEVSGIAGTSLSGVFSYEVARQLVARHGDTLEIAWDRFDTVDKLGSVLARLSPLLGEEWPVEAHIPFREWVVAAAHPRGIGDLVWLVERLERLPVDPRARAAVYEALEVPLTWSFGRARISRSRQRLPANKLYCHREPLLRRADISLARELQAPPLPVRRLPRAEARRMLDLIMDASAMRYRELYGFSHPDERGVFHADAGRGVEIVFFGVPPEWRLPLRAYHGGMFFKNGVPAGYVELLSLFDRAEVGFNLYYTFREGESAWLYARLLHLFHQVLGVTTFSVDPYQIGHENSEAVDSGAFWFYRKLGFRATDPRIAALVEREERRMLRTPGYRSTRRTLEKLAGGHIVYECPGAAPGLWDDFRVHAVGLAVQRAIAKGSDGDPEKFRRAAVRRVTAALGVESQSGLALALSLIPGLARWSKEEKALAVKIMQAKQGADDARYLRLMQTHPRLRAAFVTLGAAPESDRLPSGV